MVGVNSIKKNSYRSSHTKEVAALDSDYFRHVSPCNHLDDSTTLFYSTIAVM